MWSFVGMTFTGQIDAYAVSRRLIHFFFFSILLLNLFYCSLQPRIELWFAMIAVIQFIDVPT